MITVMFNDGEGSFPPVDCSEEEAEALCEDLALMTCEGTCDDEEESDDAK